MIEIEQARDLLLKAVATQGRAFVYNPDGTHTCTYQPQADAPEGSPRKITGCLIGVALSLAGEERHLGMAGNVYALAAKYPDMLSVGALGYFAVAQQVQDAGDTWGEAFDAAEKLYREGIGS